MKTKRVNFEVEETEEEELFIKEKRGSIKKIDDDSDQDEQDMFGIETQPQKIDGEEEPESEFIDGIRIEPFNMKSELEEGSFDKDGHYIREKDTEAVHDSWLKGVSKDDILRAYNAKNRYDAREEAIKTIIMDPVQLWLRLLNTMKPGESIVDTIRRIGGPPKKRMNKKKIKQNEEDILKGNKAAKEIECITVWADELLANGNHEVYELTYEQIVRKLRIDEVIDDNWLPGDSLSRFIDCKSTVEESKSMWEYKWKEESEEVFGPFEETQIIDWLKGGHFTKDVFVRRVTHSTPLDPKKDFQKIDSVSEFNKIN